MGRNFITPDNRSALVEIIVWFNFVVAALTVIVRSAIKIWVLKHFQLDDYAIIFSLALAIAQSLTTSLAASHGFGRREDIRDASDNTGMLQLLYSSQILLVIGLALSKLSLAIYLRNLSPNALNKKISLGVFVAIGFWGVTSVFLLAFQCGSTAPWNILSDKCLNLSALYDYVGIFSILTEVVMVVQPLLIIRGLKLRLRRKLPIHAAFAARISVAVAVIFQLAYTNPAFSSSDPVFNLWPAQVTAQFAQSLSILTASTVFLKPFLDSIESGFLKAGRGDGLGSSATPGSSYKLSTRGNMNRSSRAYAKLSGHSAEEYELQRPKPTRQRSSVGYQATATPALHAHHDSDADSRSRILQTRTITVEHGGQV